MKSALALLLLILSVTTLSAQDWPDERPLRSVSYGLALIPSASQYYKDERVKADRIMVSFSLAAATAGAYQLVYNQRNERYKEKVSNSGGPAAGIDRSIAKAKAQVETMQLMRNIFVVTTATIYVGSLIDGILPPQDGFRYSKVEISAVTTPMSVGFRVSW